jgi:hypothetical protein
LGAFAITGPTLLRSINAYRRGVYVYNQYIGSAYDGVALNFDHSILALIKQCTRVILGWPHGAIVDQFVDHIYVPYLVAICVGFLVCAVVLWKMPFLNQVMGIFTCMVLLPPAGYDYELLQLYIPWAIFISALCCREKLALTTKQLWFFLGSFAVIFTAQTFLRTQWNGMGGLVKCFAVLTLLYASLRFPLYSPSLKKQLE